MRADSIVARRQVPKFARDFLRAGAKRLCAFAIDFEDLMETRRFRGASARLTMVAVVCCAVSAVKAEPAPPLSVLLLQPEERAPRLAESGANIRAAEGGAAQAGLRPNPTASLLDGNIGRGRWPH